MNCHSFWLGQGNLIDWRPSSPSLTCLNALKYLWITLFLQVDELPFLLTRAGELERLKALITKFDVFKRMVSTEEGKFELIKAWQQVTLNTLFIRPSSDRSYYGMVMSVRVSVQLSARPSVRLSVLVSVRPFSTLFSYMLWHIELKICTWLCFNVLRIKFECRHFASIFEGVMPLCEFKI